LLERGEPGALATLRISLSRPEVASSNLAGPTTIMQWDTIFLGYGRPEARLNI